MTEIKDSGERREFSTGAVRDMSAGKGRFDLLCPYAENELAKHMEKGCAKYGDRNWEKGIPQHSFIDSAKRHLNKVQRGLHDEDHLVAAYWNLHCAISQRERIKLGLLPAELDDLPFPTVEPQRDRIDADTKDKCMNACDKWEDENGSVPCGATVCGSAECHLLLQTVGAL